MSQAAVAAGSRARKISLPSELPQQLVSQPPQPLPPKTPHDQLQQQKIMQQVQQEQQLQRQRHHEQQLLLLQPQQHRPAAAAARELAADLRAQHVAPGAGAGAAAAFRVPIVPAATPPVAVAVPAQAPSSPSAAAGHFEHEIPFQDLQLGKLLGSGSFGDVCVYHIPVPFCAAGYVT